MARKIVILTAAGFTAGQQRYVSAAFWLVPLTSRRQFYAQTGAKSQVKDATTQEVADLAAGNTVEVVENGMQFPPSFTLAAVEAELATKYNDYQTRLNADDQYQRAGSSWDGTTWTIVNNIT